MEQLVLRFVGYNMISNVVGQIGGDIENMVGRAEKGAARIQAAFMAAGSGFVAFGKGIGAVTLALAGLAGYAVKGASDLEFQLNLLQTHAAFADADRATIVKYQQAQAALGNTMSYSAAQIAYAKSQVDLLRSGLLELSPQVGYTATEMAQ